MTLFTGLRQGEILGHATASFTLDVYGHVSQKMRQASADHVEQFYRQVSST